MPKLILLVLDDENRLTDVLDAWHRHGVAGITVIESSGLARLREAFIREDAPLFPRLSDVLEDSSLHHQTLFTVIPDAVDVEALFDATEAVLGPLDAPNSGIIVALPVLSTRGLHRRRRP